MGAASSVDSTNALRYDEALQKSLSEFTINSSSLSQACAFRRRKKFAISNTTIPKRAESCAAVNFTEMPRQDQESIEKAIIQNTAEFEARQTVSSLRCRHTCHGCSGNKSNAPFINVFI